MKENLKAKISQAYNNIILHWKTPPLGKYVAYKEVIMYGIGGMGKEFIVAFSVLIALSATSFLVGNTIGIKPMDLQYMSIASTAIGFGITILRSYLIDNSKFKGGKFRPWFAITGIPTVIISIVFVWLPYETMSYMGKVAAVFICYNLLQMVYPFYTQSYTDFVNVISPNSEERTDIVSVSAIIYSFAPSLTGLFIPMFSTFTGGLNNIQTYRIIYPIVAIVGLALGYFAYFGTKERIVEAKSHIANFKFFDAFRAVAKNKYFWITSLAGWLGFLEGAVGVIIGWTFIYGHPESMTAYGLITTLIGNAALWAMILCPFAIKTIGKRNLLIWCNVANILLISALYPLYKNLAALVIIYYLNGFVGSFAHVYNPGISADMRDYQQYRTGERIDGMFGAVGIIGSFVGMFTGLVIPYIYQSLGLKDNYNVMEVTSFREDMFEVLIIASIIGAAMNCIPYFFYDLTEIKQKGIVRVLKIRALFEDYGNGILQDEALVEAIDIIDEANRLYEYKHTIVTKDDIAAARKLPKQTEQEKEYRKTKIEETRKKYGQCEHDIKAEAAERISSAKAMPASTDEEKAARKTAIKAAKKENKDRRHMIKEISVCNFVVDEMNKFSTDRIKAKVSAAEKLIAGGTNALYSTPESVLKDAKKLPKKTYEQREIRNDAVAHARALLACKKNLKRYYPDRNIDVPEEAEFEKIEQMNENTLGERIAKKKAAKVFLNRKSHYTRTMKVWLDADRIITEQENYTHLEEIRRDYEAAKARTEMNNAEKQAEHDRLEAERRADVERRKAERQNKKISAKTR